MSTEIWKFLFISEINKYKSNKLYPWVLWMTIDSLDRVFQNLSYNSKFLSKLSEKTILSEIYFILFFVIQISNVKKIMMNDFLI